MAATRLLVVEDEFLIRMTLSEVLADDGYDVVEAGDAAEALEALKSPGEFAAMLTDIQLPGGMDGRTLAATARQARPQLPVIFMSGRPDPDAGHNPLDVHVSKPYLPSTISAAVRKLVGAA
ncbi:response regulator [Acetobacteraceae bacterium KSS8]|uniref:Response regulator n=1 Tax=Endosaccharibacter trunci TaxID=2812733 RepID=A0ABT1WA33_9PROT|nr:response regulator [Acetobacteraceae bacterium KSS8]